ncbi:MAG: hypothetical protein K2N99_01585, partial [Malacoplasma sp.]|nr:hypothetical protein [Malacoplasma sp.]
MVLSTGTSSFYFDLTKKNKLLTGYNYYMIEPTDVFSFDKKKNRFVYKPDYDENDPTNTATPYLDYVDKYNKATDIEGVTEVSFPYYMRYENTSDPKIQIYDMFINKTELLSFTEYKEVYALDKLDIAFLRIQRNPFRGSLTGSFDKNQKNTYYLSFICYVGTNTLNKLYIQSHSDETNGNYVNSPSIDLYKKQYVTFEVSMTGVNDNIKYTLDPTRLLITNADTMLEDGFVAYQATFETNNFVSNDKQIQLKGIVKGTSISYDYSVYVPVDTTVKFAIKGTFNDSENNPNNNSCITYETDSVVLVDYKTDDFKIDFDIESVIPGYETYGNDVPYTYEINKYIKNNDYNPAIEVLTHPNHYEYEVETNDDGKVIFLVEGNEPIPLYKYAHKAGDVIFDYTELSEEEIEAGPSKFKEYYIESGKI